MLRLEPPYCHTRGVEERSKEGYQAHVEVCRSMSTQAVDAKA